MARILWQLLIRQTKSRARRSTDNALVEGKNGAVVRKFYGYFHIPATRGNVLKLNWLNEQWLNPYLNFHRPCGFAVLEMSSTGKVIKKYPRERYQTPYEKLKSLPDAPSYLKQGISFEKLDLLAYQKSDTQFAIDMQKQKAIIFSQLTL